MNTVKTQVLSWYLLREIISLLILNMQNKITTLSVLAKIIVLPKGSSLYTHTVFIFAQVHKTAM
jgi:hypothetical protein